MQSSNALPLSAEKFMKLKIPEREKLLGEWLLQKSAVLVSGYTGCGKSQFLLGMALSLVQGGAFLDWKVGRKCKVCLFDGELDDATIQERIRLHSGSEIDDLSNLYIYSGDLCHSKERSFPNLRNQEERKSVLKELRGMDVVIFDNINCLFPGGDENSTDFWTPVDDLILQARRLGITPVLVHHTSKSNNRSSSGSSKNERVAEVVVMLSKVPGSAANELFCNVEFQKVRHLPTDVDSFAVRFSTESEQGALWTKDKFIPPCSDRERENRLEEAVQRVSQGESLRAVAAGLDIPKSTISDRIKWMKQSRVSGRPAP
jgi:KaiC/GvpD/RAD55 family RecA-like ATPase